MKKIVIFNLWHGPNIDDLTEGSNSWYLKNYEKEFDQVIHLSLIGKRNKNVSNGKTSFVINTTGNNKTDLITAPFKLLLFILKSKPTQIATYDQVWLWWLIFPLKLFTNYKVSLIPMTFPDQMHELTKRSISGILTIWIEKRFIQLGYRMCDIIVTSSNLGNYINWLKDNPIINKKLKILTAIPESVVFPSFTKKMNKISNQNIRRFDSEKLKLIYVGRLQKEKKVEDLISSLKIVSSKYPKTELTIIGSGPEQELLINLIKEHGLENNTKLLGYIPNENLPEYLLSSDIFVSPLTGCSFREAAFCGLPIVAYNLDWIKGYLTHKVNFYGVEKSDHKQLAEGIIEVYEGEKLREKLSTNITIFAKDNWSESALDLNYKLA